ncbi:hypothetical protein LUZ60_000254 [Juncus effusus]|nr:hypothetical protein LUZ60_000254 [Juncus effusus]
MAGWTPVSDRDSFFAWLRSEFAASNAIIDALIEHLRLTGGSGEFDDLARWVQCRRSGWAPVLHMQQYVSVGEVRSALHEVRLRKQRIQMEKPDREEESSASEIEEKKSDDLLVQNGEMSDSNGHENQKGVKLLKLTEGNAYNELEGLALYEDFVDESSLSELVSYLHEMRDKGLNGELQGKTMVVSIRPKNGHARETLQFGLPITDGTLKKIKFDPTNSSMVEPIPGFIQDVLDQIMDMQILKEKPDYCVVDFLYEREYLHPHYWKSWYGRPICTLFLTECDVVFGKVLISTPYYGDYTGSLRLSLSSGSLLVMQGKSVDVAKRAVPSQPKKRIILTFGKSQPLDESNTSPSPYKMQPHGPSYKQAPPIYQNYSSSAFHPVTPLFMGNPNPGNCFPPPGNCFINPGNYFTPGNCFPNPGNCFPVPGTGVFLPHNRSGRKSKSVRKVPPLLSCANCNDSAIQEVTGSGIDEINDGTEKQLVFFST